MRTSTEEEWKHLVFAGILSVFGTRCCFIFHQLPICLCHSFISGTCRERIFSIFPIFTRWINTSRFDFKSQHQQFVMRWAIISVHVISFNSAYNIPNSWRTHSHPYCCCLHAFFLVAVLLFSPFGAINRYRCVNTCFTVEHKIGYFNITMTTWCLQHSICSICHIFNR